jgi:hypothetical protein
MSAIGNCLENIKNKKFEAELKSLLNLKFQLYDNVIYNRVWYNVLSPAGQGASGLLLTEGDKQF